MAVNNASKFFHFPNTVLKAGVSLSSYSPWDVLVTAGVAGAYTYVIIPSTVNSVVPSNYSTVGTGNVSSEKYISLTVSTTNGRVTSVVIASSGSPNDSPSVLQSIPPSSFSIALGVIGTDGIFYKFVAGLPIVVSPSVSFESDRTPSVPGLSPRIQWWTWIISQP